LGLTSSTKATNHEDLARRIAYFQGVMKPHLDLVVEEMSSYIARDWTKRSAAVVASELVLLGALDI
jgi:hypothetical protein